MTDIRSSQFVCKLNATYVSDSPEGSQENEYLRLDKSTSITSLTGSYSKTLDLVADTQYVFNAGELTDFFGVNMDLSDLAFLFLYNPSDYPVSMLFHDYESNPTSPIEIDNGLIKRTITITDSSGALKEYSLDTSITIPAGGIWAQSISDFTDGILTFLADSDAQIQISVVA